MLKLIAHRGASKVRPENTLESLCYAAQIGADGYSKNAQEAVETAERLLG